MVKSIWGRLSWLSTFLFAIFFFVSSAFFEFLFLPRSACAAQGSITVSAAISLKNAFEEMAGAFEAEKQNQGAKIFFNFGSSGDLASQIEAGAPVDVFASAAEKQMDELAKKGLIVPGTRKDFAKNVLVLIVPAGRKNPKTAEVSDFGGLAGAGVTKIAMGNPATVPAGMYSEEVLRDFRLWRAVKGKLVYGEHVREVLAYVERDEVDAGLVYSTDAAIVGSRVRVVAVAPHGSHQPIRYPIAVMAGSGNRKLALAFVSFIESRQGRTILRKFGFPK